MPFFKNDSEKVHTANNSMHSLDIVFGNTITNRGLWPPHLPDLILDDVLFMGYVNG